jgi:hypothetical protein
VLTAYGRKEKNLKKGICFSASNHVPNGKKKEWRIRPTATNHVLTAYGRKEKNKEWNPLQCYVLTMCFLLTAA